MPPPQNLVERAGKNFVAFRPKREYNVGVWSDGIAFGDEFKMQLSYPNS